VSRWRPGLGATCERGGTTFRVWAPGADRVDVLLERGPGTLDRRQLAHEPGGYFASFADDVGAGTRYRFQVGDGDPRPDPASRWQPDGVHGASAVVDPGSFPWTDGGWRLGAVERLVAYELHVGTFSPEGTFAGAAAKLEALADLGVTAIELMPLADFPGNRNWGYDGVALFAPARCYGAPDELRGLVNRAHELGLAIILDVVYNHLGPDGNYLGAFTAEYFTERHQTPWGAAVNLDGDAAGAVRGFLIENACRWLDEYHFDGLRLDATHALYDDSPRHFLAELTEEVRSAMGDRAVWLVAEDHRNLATMVRPIAEGGWGLDAVWADDLHHQIRCHVAGDRDGYYADYTGSTTDIATTIANGWFYTGQHSAHRGRPRGTDPCGLPPACFVVCVQNHDQIGNRAMGDRLHHQVDAATWRAVSTLLLLVPEIPLLFMGQEWAASAPFQYFTDHNAELGRLVTEGRRGEFRHFAAFADEARAAAIPDPQAASTFEHSRLDWDEIVHQPHAAVRRLYRALLKVRASLDPVSAGQVEAVALDTHTVAIGRRSGGRPIVAVVRLSAAGPVEGLERILDDTGDWQVMFSTEQAEFAPEPVQLALRREGSSRRLEFARPGAVLLVRR
jgi:maltooligosyltrehalose trehalohydrolase